MFRLTKFILGDLSKNWILILYFGFLLASTFGLFMMEGQSDKALVSLLNLTLMVVPMMTLLIGTIYYYNMYEFIVMILAQPIKRKTVIASIYLGLSIAFSLAFILGLGIPLGIMGFSQAGWMLILVGLLLTWVFVGLALWAGVLTRDKAKGMGFSLLIWVYFVLIFDGLILLLMYNFSDYPIEKGVLMITFLNPVDLGRILVLMQTQAAALMGYSGAVFRHFFEAWWGLIVAIGVMGIWALVPVWGAFRKFKRKDL
ncbi:ABC transporter permease subunit [Echinicola jeungdonensis]|uniref:ABC transporter permease subunit n=1 Tax=Echinicola jeungdonensis TaxID=709343 RepID=A0ABV5J342_9BACT|nr:ABC transporter permease subunit [Echinicola jeungdonensis]MDN3670690.1 ABC transporter permease subunit [Echinicola jeungdonensis]